jgi:hypothetical protein
MLSGLQHVILLKVASRNQAMLTCADAKKATGQHLVRFNSVQKKANQGPYTNGASGLHPKGADREGATPINTGHWDAGGSVQHSVATLRPSTLPVEDLWHIGGDEVQSTPRFMLGLSRASQPELLHVCLLFSGSSLSGYLQTGTANGSVTSRSKKTSRRCCTICPKELPEHALSSTGNPQTAKEAFSQLAASALLSVVNTGGAFGHHQAQEDVPPSSPLLHNTNASHCRGSRIVDAQSKQTRFLAQA